MALANLVDDLAMDLNKGKAHTAIFIDLKKAFDTLDHNILISKLKAHGIVGTPLAWLQNYLTTRGQCVLANNNKSPVATIRSGVPQGSILGPLLFNIYINDLPSRLHNTKTQLYADDTVIYHAEKTADNTRSKLQTTLDCLKH